MRNSLLAFLVTCSMAAGATAATPGYITVGTLADPIHDDILTVEAKGGERILTLDWDSNRHLRTRVRLNHAKVLELQKLWRRAMREARPPKGSSRFFGLVASGTAQVIVTSQSDCILLGVTVDDQGSGIFCYGKMEQELDRFLSQAAREQSHPSPTYYQPKI